MIERKCPSCGGNVSFRTSILLLSVCPYCRMLVQRKDLDLEALGVVAQLQPDGTPLQIGARGEFKGAPFDVVGRVQLKTSRGYWNEWSLLFADQRQGWLGEAQGVYAVSFKLDASAPAWGELKLGATVVLDQRGYKVRDLLEASYVAAEGELPFRPPLGETAASADLISEEGWFATIDYSETPAIVFAGQYQDFDSLKLTGLKAMEGWS